MKKRFLAIFIVLTIAVCMFPVSAYADYLDHNSLPSMVGILTSDDGSSYIIRGELISTPLNLNSSANSATIKYELPASIMQRGSVTENGNDGGYVSTVYLTITYSTKNTPTEYLLTGVSGYWVISDSMASVESANLSYGCSGLFPSPTTQAVNGLSVGNWFNIQTGFSDYVSSVGYSVMGANLTVNYLMGTARRWSFTLTNNLFNN